jgi:long-chain acyl-CoA synthetase
MLHKRGSRWEALEWREVLRRVAGLSRALEELGVRAGDRVGLFAGNRPEWHIVDFASSGLGGVLVPIYFNEAPERINYILNDSGARVAIAVGEEQVRRLLGCRQSLPNVEHFILGDAPQDAGNEHLRLEVLAAPADERDVARYRERAARVKSEHLATIIYTSGTTGEPKGVMLSHHNLASNSLDSVREFELLPSDVALSFLPLAHVYERTMGYNYLFNNTLVAYVERLELLPLALREAQPTVAAAVPRVFEKTFSNIEERARQLTGWKRRLYAWAMETARRAMRWRAYGDAASPWLKLKWHLANLLVFRRIREALGGRVRAFITGSAPLALELLEFFWSIDVKIFQGYGLTESSPIVSTNTPAHNRMGSVGRPIPHVEVRIAEDGEILVRGPCVMMGYFNKAEATAEALKADGWLATGDVGRLDADGYLYVTDRKKDLLKTAAGKFVAPQPIENKLKTSPYIQNAVLIGDRLKFVSAIIVPNFSAVEAKAEEAGLRFAGRTELASHPWVRDLIRGEIERLTPMLAQFETIKRFAVLDHDFSFEGGQLSYSMKVKRHIIEQRYAELIAQMYAPSGP